MQENKAFIDLLNAAPAIPSHWRDILPVAERGLWQFWPRQSREAQKLFRRHMEAWIHSGFQPDGSEAPAKRTYVTWGGQLVFESLEGLLNSFLVIEGPREETVFGLQANNSKQENLRGSLRLLFDPRGGIRADPVLFRNHLSAGELSAMGFFYFWNSGQLLTIMQCGQCGVFALPRKPRQSYKHGWHCERCRHGAAARAATAQTRKALRDRWFAEAVKGLLEFDRHPRRSDSDRTVFITDYVNAKLPALHRIKRNRITRNITEIQAVAEGRKRNAKG